MGSPEGVIGSHHPEEKVLKEKQQQPWGEQEGPPSSRGREGWVLPGAPRGIKWLLGSPPQRPPWCTIPDPGGAVAPSWAGLISLPVFSSGGQYWLFREANLEPGYPQPLSSYGPGLPQDRVDAAVWWEPTGHTFFFRGDR